MGSFNVSCNLTQDTISGGDRVVVVMLTPNKHYDSMPCYAWDLYAPIPIMIEGTYNSYGAIEDYSIYQSQPFLSEQESTKLLKFFVNYLKNNTESHTNVKDSIDCQIKFIVPNHNLKIVQTLIEMSQADSNVVEIVLGTLKQIGLKSIEEAKQFIEDNESTTFPVNFVYFKKDKLDKLLNTFGNYTNEEHYATKLQSMRQGKGNTDELADTVGFVTGTSRFAGNNRPALTWQILFDDMGKKTSKTAINQSHIDKVTNGHALDLNLLNEFFSLGGKTWTPSLYMSEDIRSYGQIEAYQMQQELMQPESPKKTAKKK